MRIAPRPVLNGRVERTERERMAALEQAGYKQNSYGAHASDDSRCAEIFWLQTAVGAVIIFTIRSLACAIMLPFAAYAPAERCALTIGLCSAVFASVPNTQFSTFESRLKTYRQWPHSAAIRPLAVRTSDRPRGAAAPVRVVSPCACVLGRHGGACQHTLKRDPHPCSQTPSALASQGFYFAPDDHYKDRVLCAFCNLELAEWGPKDDPIYEHGIPACDIPVRDAAIALEYETRL